MKPRTKNSWLVIDLSKTGLEIKIESSYGESILNSIFSSEFTIFWYAV